MAFEFGISQEIWDASETLFKLIGVENSLRHTLRALAIFSLTQTMHYFVWLKAVAEQNLRGENPASFSRSFGKIRMDYGLPVTALILASCVLFWFYALINYSAARFAYGYIAFSHGLLGNFGPAFGLNLQEIGMSCLSPLSVR